jgi:hypothetical protein
MPLKNWNESSSLNVLIGDLKNDINMQENDMVEIIF